MPEVGGSWEGGWRNALGTLPGVLSSMTSEPEPLRRMPDGTVKQVNPYSGTSVWTVARRGHRPLALPAADPMPLAAADAGQWCAFCEARYLETPPEKARVVRDSSGWRVVEGVLADDVDATIAQFRRIPNLYEILGYDYWRTNYGFRPDSGTQARQAGYLATPAGREHVRRLARIRLLADGMSPATWESLPEEDQLRHGIGMFASSHDVVVARRHFVDGATSDDQLASSGTLTPQEHAHYTAFTIDAMRSLYEGNRYIRFVAAFQNWLKPAGASFDHLHKQLVGVDDRSIRMQMELHRVRANGNFYNENVVDYASRHNLLVAENESAVAFAGFGHRHPSLEIYSKSPVCRPWEQSPEEQRAVSDLLHACHAATGAEVPCNEEWHHQAPDVDVPTPWRIVVKWRVSTLAGFEGGTKIYLNTIDPWSLRDRVAARLLRLRDEGRLAPGMAIAGECRGAPNSLRYNPNLWRAAAVDRR